MPFFEAVDKNVGGVADFRILGQDGLDVKFYRSVTLDLRRSDVFWDVDVDGTRTTFKGEVESLLQDVAGVVGILDDEGFFAGGRKHHLRIGRAAKASRFVERAFAPLPHGRITSNRQERQRIGEGYSHSRK